MAFDIFNDKRMFDMQPEERAPVIQTYFNRKYSNDPRILSMQPDEVAAVRDNYTQQALKAVDYFQAPPEQRGVVGNIASKLLGGVGETIQQTGAGIQLLDSSGFKDEGTVADTVGRSIRNVGEYISNSSTARPTQPELHGERSTLGQGWDSFIGSTPGSMTPWAVGASATALAASNPFTLPVAPAIGVVAGTAALALSFGGGTAKMKYDEAISRGVPHNVAMKEAGVQGMAEAIPEWVGDAVLYKVLGKTGAVVKGGLNATLNEIKSVGLKEFGSLLMKTMPVELTGELATTYTALKSDERMGYPKQDMQDALAVTALSTVFMSLGFGAGGFGLSKVQQDNFYKGLNAPVTENRTPEQVKAIRSHVADSISKRIAEGTGNNEFAQSWLNGANLAIEAGTPIDMSTKLIDFASSQMENDKDNDPMSTPYVDQLLRKNGIEPDSGRFLSKEAETPLTADILGPEATFGQTSRDYVQASNIGEEAKVAARSAELKRGELLASWEEAHKSYSPSLIGEEEKSIADFKKQQEETATEASSVAEHEAAYKEYVANRNNPKYIAEIKARKASVESGRLRAEQGQKAFMEEYGASELEKETPDLVEEVSVKPQTIAQKVASKKKEATTTKVGSAKTGYIGGQAVSMSPESLIYPTDEEQLAAAPARKLVSKNLAPDMPQEGIKHPIVSAILNDDINAIKEHLADFTDSKLADTPEELANTHTNTLLLAAKNAVASLPPSDRGKALPRVANTIAKANKLLLSKAGVVQTGLTWTLKDNILNTEYKPEGSNTPVKYMIMRGYEFKEGAKFPTPKVGKAIYRGDNNQQGNVVAPSGADNRQLQIAFEKNLGIAHKPSEQMVTTGSKRASDIFGDEFAAQIASEKGKAPLKKGELEKTSLEESFTPSKEGKPKELVAEQKVTEELPTKEVKDTGKGIRKVSEREINAKREALIIARTGAISNLELEDIKVGTPIMYEVDGAIVHSTIRAEDIGDGKVRNAVEDVTDLENALACVRKGKGGKK